MQERRSRQKHVKKEENYRLSLEEKHVSFCYPVDVRTCQPQNPKFFNSSKLVEKVMAPFGHLRHVNFETIIKCSHWEKTEQCSVSEGRKFSWFSPNFAQRHEKAQGMQLQKSPASKCHKKVGSHYSSCVIHQPVVVSRLLPSGPVKLSKQQVFIIFSRTEPFTFSSSREPGTVSLFFCDLVCAIHAASPFPASLVLRRVRDAVGYCRKDFSIFFSEISVTNKSQKMPNLTNTWRHQTAKTNWRIWKKPDNKSHVTKRWCILGNKKCDLIWGLLKQICPTINHGHFHRGTSSDGSKWHNCLPCIETGPTGPTQGGTAFSVRASKTQKESAKPEVDNSGTKEESWRWLSSVLRSPLNKETTTAKVGKFCQKIVFAQHWARYEARSF